METHYATCTDPAVVGLAEHMLVVARKLQISGHLKVSSSRRERQRIGRNLKVQIRANP